MTMCGCGKMGCATCEAGGLVGRVVNVPIEPEGEIRRKLRQVIPWKPGALPRIGAPMATWHIQPFVMRCPKCGAHKGERRVCEGCGHDTTRWLCHNCNTTFLEPTAMLVAAAYEDPSRKDIAGYVPRRNLFEGLKNVARGHMTIEGDIVEDAKKKLLAWLPEGSQLSLLFRPGKEPVDQRWRLEITRGGVTRSWLGPTEGDVYARAAGQLLQEAEEIVRSLRG